MGNGNKADGVAVGPGVGQSMAQRGRRRVRRPGSHLDEVSNRYAAEAMCRCVRGTGHHDARTGALHFPVVRRGGVRFG